MSILSQMDLDNVPDLELIPDGETEMRIMFAEEGESKSSGKPMITVGFEALDHPNSDIVYEYFVLPDEQNDKPRSVIANKRKLKSFIQAFGLPLDDVEAWQGSTGWVNIGSEEDNRNPGKFRNRIGSYVSGGGKGDNPF